MTPQHSEELPLCSENRTLEKEAIFRKRSFDPSLPAREVSPPPPTASFVHFNLYYKPRWKVYYYNILRGSRITFFCLTTSSLWPAPPLPRHLRDPTRLPCTCTLSYLSLTALCGSCLILVLTSSFPLLLLSFIYFSWFRRSITKLFLSDRPHRHQTKNYIIGLFRAGEAGMDRRYQPLHHSLPLSQ
jgi:hypothetical protein